MNQEAIWDYFQNEGRASFDESFARLVFIARQTSRNSKVLNVGIGAGFFEAEALSRGIDVYSLDPNTRAIEGIRDRLKLGAKAMVGFSQDIPFSDGFFDGVVMSEVLEHLPDDVLRDTLAEVSRVLVPGGAFLGTVPSNEDLDEQIVICPCCGNRFHRWGHLQSFDEIRLRRILEYNFEVRSLSARNFVNWKTRNWKGRAYSMLKIVLWRLGIHGGGETIYFCARKRLSVRSHPQDHSSSLGAKSHHDRYGKST